MRDGRGVGTKDLGIFLSGDLGVCGVLGLGLERVLRVSGLGFGGVQAFKGVPYLGKGSFGVRRVWEVVVGHLAMYSRLVGSCLTWFVQPAHLSATRSPDDVLFLQIRPAVLSWLCSCCCCMFKQTRANRALGILQAPAFCSASAPEKKQRTGAFLK